MSYSNETEDGSIEIICEDYKLNQQIIENRNKENKENQIDDLNLANIIVNPDFLNKDYSSVIENCKKIPVLTKEAIEMLEKDAKIRAYQQRDITLFCIVHEELIGSLETEFKSYINSIIDNYISKGITYLIKIHSHVPYEQTAGADCFTDKETRKTEINGMYSRGNCWREVIEQVPWRKRDEFLKYKAGMLGLRCEEDLKRLTMLRSNEYYSIFEIVNVK